MQRRLLLFSGLGGALAGLVLLLVLLGQRPPEPVRPIVEQEGPPTPERAAVPRAKRVGGVLRGKVVDGKIFDEQHREVPIEGATVLALVPYLERERLGPGQAPRWGNYTVGARTGTGADGTFTLGSLPKDYWNLWVQKKGYGFTTIPRLRFDKDHLVKLYPGGKIRGRVIYSNGEPATGVHIEYTPQGLQSEVFSRYNREQWFETTDAHGEFRYTELPPGLFTVEVYDTEHLPAPWADEPALKPGEDRDLGTRILDPGFTMTVKVLWLGTGEPVEGIEVVVRPIGDPMPRTKIGQRRLTDRSGTARFQGLGGQKIPNPRFQVTAILPGVGPVQPDQSAMWEAGSEIVIYLRRRGIVKGKVERPDGSPLERFHVTMEPVGHVQRPPAPAWGRDGAFRVYGVPEGKYDVVVRYGNLMDAVQHGVEAKAGVEVDVGTIRMEPGSMIVGTLRRASGKPLEETVLLHLGRKKADRPETVRRAYAQTDGSYTIKGVPPGTFYLWPEGARTNEPVQIVIDRQGEVRRVDLVLWGEGFLDLEFLDVAGGRERQALPPAVRLTPQPDGEPVAWTSNGLPLRPGRYALSFLVPDHSGTPRRLEWGTVDIQEGETKGPIRVRWDDLRAKAAEQAQQEASGPQTPGTAEADDERGK
ncbi:MAG: hypothetical protein ACE5JG_05285 [Planctomycetota bacterium]